MIGLTYGGKNYNSRPENVSIEYRNATDGRTDRQADGRTDRIAISTSRVSTLTRDKKRMAMYLTETTGCLGATENAGVENAAHT